MRKDNPYLDLALNEAMIKQAVEFRFYVEYLLKILEDEGDEAFMESPYKDYQRFCADRKTDPVSPRQYWRVMNYYETKNNVVYVRKLKKKKRGFYLKGLVLKRMINDFSKNYLTRSVQMIKLNGVVYYVTTIITEVAGVAEKVFGSKKTPAPLPEQKVEGM